MPVWDTPIAAPDEAGRARVQAAAAAFWDGIKEPCHGEFKLGKEVKKYMFVPPGYLNGPQDKVRDSILTHWNLKAPNLVISINNSLNCPSTFVDIGSTDEFRADVEQARTFETKAGSKGSAEQVNNEKITEVINTNYQRRLESLIGSVAAAVEMTGSWLYSTAPTTSSYLMDEAMDKLASTPTWIENSDCGTSDITMSNGAGLKWATQLLETAVPLHEHVGKTVDLNEFEKTEKSWCKGLIGNNQCIYGKWASFGATHFIFSKVQGALNEYAFGPVGRLVINGGGMSLGKTMEVIRAHRPVILFKHSGRVAHSFSSLIETMLEYRRQRVATPPPFSEWAKHSKLDLPIVQECYDLMRADPEGTLFSETVVVANPQVHSCDELLSKVSTSFASVYKGVPELGAGEADKATTMYAWRQHKLLRENMARQRWFADVLGNLAIALTFLSTSVAVCYTVVNHIWDKHKERMYPWLRDFRGSPHWKYVDWAMICIPALASLILSLLSLKDYRRKAGDFERAAARILCEIYMFRMRVGNYTLIDGGTANASVVQHRARHFFSDELRNVLHSVGNRVGNDHMQASTGGEAGDWVPDYMRSLRPKQRAAELPRTGALVHETGSGQSREDEEKGSFRALEAQPLVEGFDAWPPTSGVGSMSVETYMAERTSPLLSELQGQAPRFSWWFTFYKLIGFLATTAASILAAFGMTPIIPLAVAVGQVANELLQKENMESRLAATNEAVSELSNCLIFWESSGIVERGMPQAREYIVSSTEHIALRVLGTSSKTSDASAQAQIREATKKKE